MSHATAGSTYCATCDRTFEAGLTLCPSDGGRLIRIGEDPLLHRTLDERFRLDERIGSGGMGAVYRAWQLSVSRPVAVKVIRAQAVADDAAIKRFLREAQLASRLNHPHIVSIIDFGQTPDGLLYLVMELCAGRSLDDLLREDGPLSVARTIAIAMQICDGLASAHRQEIIHRDLKPSNLMQLDDNDDLVKILDFGLARSLSGDHSTITRSDVMLGTPTHMAPEVVRGQPFDARSDLYALGVVLFALLTGAPPFESDTVESVLALHVTAPVPSLGAAFPPALDALVQKLLAKEPSARYASATQLKAALVALRQSLSPDALEFRAPRRDVHRKNSSSAAFDKTAGGAHESHQISRPISGQITSAPAPTSPADPTRSTTVPIQSRRWLWGVPVAAMIVAIALWLPTRKTPPMPSATPTAPTAPTNPTPQPTPTPPAPSVVRLSLDGEADASVSVDGKRVGVLPMVYTTERSDQPLTFSFTGKAKKPITKRIVPDQNQTLTVELPPPPKPKTKSTPSSNTKPTFLP